MKLTGTMIAICFLVFVGCDNNTYIRNYYLGDEDVSADSPDEAPDILEQDEVADSADSAEDPDKADSADSSDSAEEPDTADTAEHDEAVDSIESYRECRRAEDCTAFGNNFCIISECVDGYCEYHERDSLCDDGNDLTIHDSCRHGECVGEGVECTRDDHCENNNPCFLHSCEEHVCKFEIVDDGVRCGDGMSCEDAMCVESEYCKEVEFYPENELVNYTRWEDNGCDGVWDMCTTYMFPVTIDENTSSQSHTVDRYCDGTCDENIKKVYEGAGFVVQEISSSCDLMTVNWCTTYAYDVSRRSYFFFNAGCDDDRERDFCEYTFYDEDGVISHLVVDDECDGWYEYCEDRNGSSAVEVECNNCVDIILNEDGSLSQVERPNGTRCGDGMGCADGECAQASNCFEIEYYENGGHHVFQDRGCDGILDNCYEYEETEYHDNGHWTVRQSEDDGCDGNCDRYSVLEYDGFGNHINSVVWTCNHESVLYCNNYNYDSQGRHSFRFHDEECNGEFLDNDYCDFIFYGDNGDYLQVRDHRCDHEYETCRQGNMETGEEYGVECDLCVLFSLDEGNHVRQIPRENGVRCGDGMACIDGNCIQCDTCVEKGELIELENGDFWQQSAYDYGCDDVCNMLVAETYGPDGELIARAERGASAPMEVCMEYLH